MAYIIAAVVALIQCLPLALVSSLRAQPSQAYPRSAHFLHIAKAAGYSAIEDIGRLVPDTNFTSKECCWPDPYAESGQDIVTFVRHPLEHVYSQWNHCKKNLDKWFNPQNLPSSFTAWLQYWAMAGDGPAFSGEGTGFGCYIPINLQARALSCQAFPPSACPKATPALDAEVKHDISGKLKVRAQVALDRIKSSSGGAAFVGLTEFYQESMCLIHVQYTGRFPRYCNCEDQTAWRSFPMTRVTHNSGEPSKSVQLSAYERALVRQLTNVDDRIYAAAYARFMREIASVEKRFGKHILCNVSSFKQADPNSSMVFYDWDEL